VTDRQGIIQEANRAAAALLAMPQAWLVGTPFALFVPQEERPAFRTQLAALARVPRLQDWEGRLQPQDGQPFVAALSVAALPSREGQHTRLLWLLRDMTIHTQAAAALHDSEARQRAILSMAGAVVFLPFLPMLPMQILLNNFLYDLAQITIPTDNVDPSFVRTPQRWDIRLIRNFMLRIGPLSSLYDALTFGVLLGVFHASEALFHTGWFAESLATQTLVLFVIRTAGTPWQSRPSLALIATTVLIVLIGLSLPFTPVAGILGFVPLPGTYFLFLAGATLTYLGLVEVVKRRLLRHVRA
jgi:PAS domain S-box-containing protein